MTRFFTILYIKTNRLSDEKIAIGMLANFDGVPYFGYSGQKLSFSLRAVNDKLTRSIRRSLSLLESDVNKIIKGEASLSLFDQPYAKHILEKLTLKKRGVLIYGDLITLEGPVDFEKLYRKYIGENWHLREKRKAKAVSYRTQFHQFTATRRFNEFSRKKVLSPEHFNFIYSPIRVDLFRKTSYYTIFHAVDFQRPLSAIQAALTQFRLIVDSLAEDAKQNGLSKGRYYMVYRSPKQPEIRELIQKIKTENTDFELIKLSEIKDKV